MKECSSAGPTGIAPILSEYAKLYRPSAILCWSAHARRFCAENPDLVKLLEDDGIGAYWDESWGSRAILLKGAGGLRRRRGEFAF